jgi:hypothetical protein
VQAILDWMAQTPERSTISDADGSLSSRDPAHTLNYEHLLRVCGTATNAFVNLSASSGVRARRLLLLSPDRLAKHVVAEAWLHDRWAVIDPLYRTLYRGASGEFLTKEQLRDPSVFRHATEVIPNYPPEYTYELTSYVRLRRIPVIGGVFRTVLDGAAPRWEERFDWLLLERRSFAAFVLASMLVLFSLVTRALVKRYSERRVPESAYDHGAGVPMPEDDLINVDR